MKPRRILVENHRFYPRAMNPFAQSLTHQLVPLRKFSLAAEPEDSTFRDKTTVALFDVIATSPSH